MRHLLKSAAWLVAGALAACSTVHLEDPPAGVNACHPSQMFFATRIWPELLTQNYNGQTCADSACHGEAAPGRALRVIMPMSIPTYPFAAQSDWDRSYVSVTQQMLCTSVRDSELYLRPAGLRTHSATLFAPDGPEASLLEMWVAASP